MELVLNTYGVSLSRDNEGFLVVADGVKQRIPIDGIKSIQISKGAQITSDAVMLAIENEIEIIFVDKSGKPFGRVWSPRFGSISTIRKGQLNFTYTASAIEWIKEIICKKIDNQESLLYSFECTDAYTSRSVAKAINRLEDYRSKVSKITGDVLHDVAANLRGWEGMAAKIYFETLNLFIPEKYRFSKREQHPATDIVNAMLNYGYGLLYGKIEGALIKTGIDPYIGILHRDNYNRPVLVYDVIEIFRVWVDYVVYTLIAQDVITDGFYSVREDGSYWLEPHGRRILIQSLNDYLEEEITMNQLHRSRATHITLYAQNLAQYFKSFDK